MQPVVAKGADVVPAAALIKPRVTGGSQQSLDLKSAFSPPVIAQPLDKIVHD